MERELGGPVFVEELPELRESNGIMYIYRDGKCRAAMRMEVFEAYMYDGMEKVTAWRGRTRAPDHVPGRVVPFKKKQE